MAHLPAYQPMIAQAGAVPSGSDRDRWAVEMKWDGIRALLYVEDGRMRIHSRNGADVTAAYPELQMLAGAVGGHDVVLDSEIVAFDATSQALPALSTSGTSSRSSSSPQRTAVSDTKEVPQ
ncbi:ATP-dependent DNA ligase [Nonomuraea dietziae]|uniref:ATP-dependent DNA ligase n=1 Tax=Nonomuraea dietziae TaxID=65515 RepID=A0A7W5YG73_9ACTN|nr:hypothetical protein [Nonomuraea dietziae]MBB3733823.1 ATP-dependent DNA ligase [Nonomuraea dietziae]